MEDIDTLISRLHQRLAAPDLSEHQQRRIESQIEALRNQQQDQQE